MTQATRAVCITGGLGYIGIQLIKTLDAEGYDSRFLVIDNELVGSLEDLNSEAGEALAARVDWINHDIANPLPDDLRPVTEIYHLAGNTGVGPSLDNPLQDLQANIVGTFNALNYAVKHKAGVVVASSNAPLGNAEVPVTEKSVCRPLSPYGASKLAIEGYCSAFANSYGLGSTVFRFGNVYGPGSHKKSSVVAAMSRALLQNDVVFVEGTGEQTRDFIYVGDLCRALIMGMASNTPGHRELYQLAPGRETTILQLAETLCEIHQEESGRPARIEFKPGRTADIEKNFADTSHVRNTLGWNDATEFKDGLRTTYTWLKSHPVVQA
ncbi:GDP-mannose 4,6-dehydratase [Hyphobacterium sp. CCMP332]|uniref:GDP-mannose 4,6-dehydratase n=1 Tax=Hyphobacterium sp. CCMP332 TaxID=2749086 RepID=UPI00164FBBDF|nr:GDP-mannose 4,6-dehydratase [Hyphobacterium sp. CCMP332]QNL17876.1 GDP-mannose 4,6-dehydratase [Hyphobacterium sp. CCMP332]